MSNQTQINLEILSVTQLKALAFDLNNQLQIVNNNLNVVLKKLDEKIKSEEQKEIEQSSDELVPQTSN